MTDLATSTDEIVWEDPSGAQPMRGRPFGGGWQEALKPLMARPGQWARVKVYDGIKSGSQAANKINRRKTALPLGTWKATWRYIDADGKQVDLKADASGSVLYVMYEGEAVA